MAKAEPVIIEVRIKGDKTVLSCFKSIKILSNPLPLNLLSND